MHECTDHETLIYARDETHEALNSLARVFAFSRTFTCQIRVAREFQGVSNKNHTRVKRTSVKFKSSSTVSYNRAVPIQCSYGSIYNLASDKNYIPT